MARQLRCSLPRHENGFIAVPPKKHRPKNQTRPHENPAAGFGINQSAIS
jgi:hypothetical protein